MCRHTQALASSSKPFRELIVVHNLRTVVDGRVLLHRWRRQVTDLYGSVGVEGTAQVSAPTADGKLEMREARHLRATPPAAPSASRRFPTRHLVPPPAPPHRQVRWFHTERARHLALANDASSFGADHNRATVALLRVWLASSLHPTAARDGVLRQLLMR